MNATPEAVLVIDGTVMGSGDWTDCREAAIGWERRLPRTSRVEVLSLANAASKGLVEL